MKLTEFDYHLPDERIAQTPAEPRDASRLMVLNRKNSAIEHRIFRDIINYLNPGDVLVLNNTRVMPARLHAIKEDTGGKAEILLLKQIDSHTWRVLVGGKGLTPGRKLVFEGIEPVAEIIESLEGAQRIIRFSEPIDPHLPELGEMPLPPYITQRVNDPERYQTVYSKETGSAAAPTAGLHFTPDLLIELRKKGVQLAYCTLHIGLDTFQPVKVDEITEHKIHSEYAELTAENAKIINDAKLAGKRIIAVGTTAARTLETAGILSAGGDPAEPQKISGMCAWRPVIAFAQNTNLFIYPGYEWRVVDAMITNFHLPKSTLLMMISAFATRDMILAAYQTAIEEEYRFFSFGDAMFIY